MARAVMAAKAKLAKAAEAEETVCDNQREGGDNQREVAEAKLDEEMASRLCEIENGLGTAQLSAVRRARQAAAPILTARLTALLAALLTALLTALLSALPLSPSAAWALCLRR